MTIESSDFIQIAILLAIVGQGFIAIWLFSRQRRLENQRATLQAIHSICSDMGRVSNDVYDHFSEGGFDFDASPDAQLTALIDYFDYLEDISVGVNTGAYEIEVVDRIMGGIILRARARFAYFLREIRSRQNSDTIYCEFFELSDKIAERRGLEIYSLETKSRILLAEQSIRKSQSYLQKDANS